MVHREDIEEMKCNGITGVSHRLLCYNEPAVAVRVGTVDMEFQYSKYFGNAPSTGYETLLHDCLVGDATLFQRADNVEAGWGVVEPILEVWKGLPPKGVPLYQAGSWGPAEADDLLAREGRHWRNPA
ncbi:MAG: hypothetical protein EXR96_06145 [Nitrospiraceae bacterium]|nr:hypothetical protein [Nitrospiraceae bacterium]